MDALLKGSPGFDQLGSAGPAAPDGGGWAGPLDDGVHISAGSRGPQGEPLPPAIGTNERRMQVRAYNLWASQLTDRQYPSIADLDPADIADFGQYSVLLDFSADQENPRIAYLGAALASECALGGHKVERLSDVPPRSLLSRITDHYLQIIANQAPVGFEAEFVNHGGSTFLYRGILLPYSSRDDTIDFIYGVINWKELAGQGTTDELLLELEQALAPARADPILIAAAAASGENGRAAGYGTATASACAGTARPQGRKAGFLPLDDWADGPGLRLEREEEAEFCELTPDTGAQPMLADWLALARAGAAEAHECEDRSRRALYGAIGRAWDFALAAASAPEEFAALVEDAGLKIQQRAPMTPVVKLVFGADYDKTRLTEYAAALAHAQRLGLARGALGEYLRCFDGGLKGVVKAERRLRRSAAGKPEPQAGRPMRAGIARALRALPARDLASIARGQEDLAGEFALVMIRCAGAGAGEVQVLGQVPADTALMEKAARQLLA